MTTRKSPPHWTHADLDINVYGQRLLFLVDGDIDRGHAWLEKSMGTSLNRSIVTLDGSVNACAFKIVAENKPTVFVLWMKRWDGSTSSYGRLAHEALHVTIDVLEYVGFKPRLRARYSEPVCYLLDTIVRKCLESIHHERK